MKPSDYVRKGWCQGASAKDEQGIVVHPENKHAVSWCLTGAVHAAYPEDISTRANVYAKLEDRLGLLSTRLPAWNDNSMRTKAAVLAVLEAIGE